MGIVFRQSIKTSSVIVLGAILGLAFTYYQTLLMSKLQIGISRNLINQGVIVQSFLLLGVHSIAHTYIQRYAEGDFRRGVLLGFSLIVPFFAWLVFCIPYFILRSWIISKYQLSDQGYLYQYFNWLPVLALMWTYLTLFETYLLSKMKVALATFMREVLIRLLNLLLLFLFWLNVISFHAFILGTVLIYIIPLAVLIYLAAKHTEAKLSFKWGRLTRQEAKEAIHYAFYHSLIGSALNLVAFIDAIMLAPLEGASSLAVYGIATFLISFVNLPFKAMLGPTFPKLNEAYVKKDTVHLLDLFNRANLNIVIATVFVGVIILCNIHNVVRMLPKGYEVLAPIFSILLLGRLIDVSTGLNQEFISITPKYKFTFWASLVYITIAVVGNRIFIPKFGIYGAAWVATCGLAVFNIIKAVYLKLKFDLYPFEKKGLLIFPIGLLGYAVSWLIPVHTSPYIDSFIRTPLVAIVMLGLILVFNPSPDIKDYLKSIVKNKRLF